MSKKLEYILALENSQFNRALDASRVKVATVGRKMAAGFDPLMQKLTALRTSLANVVAGGALIGGAAAIGGLYKLNGVIQESIDLAGVQEQAEAKLAAVIRATGGAAGFTSGELIKMAGDLQKVTTFGDETTISAMAILATFKQIKGDQFKEATKAAMDMSTVMKMDLNSAILQIGKALNDPTKGLTALSRAGVQFTKEQTEMIKKMQESGDLMGAQKIILQELAGEFGGAAEAARGTFEGMRFAVKNAFGDLKEEIGFVFTKNQFFVEGLKILERQMISWTETIKANGPELRAYAKSVAMTFLDIGSGVLMGMDLVYRGTQGIAANLNSVYLRANLVSVGIFKVAQAAGALTDGLGLTEGAAERWKTKAEAAADASGELFDKMKENFGNMAEGSTKIQAAREALEEFSAQIEQIPTDGIGDMAKDADAAAESVAGMSKETVQYEDVLVKVNGVWELQKKEIEAIPPRIKKIMNDLDRLQNKKTTVTIVEKTVSARAAGGLIGAQRMATGGPVRWRNAINGLRLPGYGGGDRRHIIGEDGEVMIRKEAVRAAGVDTSLAFNSGNWGAVVANLMNRFNIDAGDVLRRQYGGIIGSLPTLPAPQMMAAGGLVGGSSGGGTYNFNMSFSGDVSQPSRQNARELATMVLAELKKIHKGRS